MAMHAHVKVMLLASVPGFPMTARPVRGVYRVSVVMKTASFSRKATQAPVRPCSQEG